MGIKSPLERQRLGSDWLGSSSAEKDLGDLVDSNLNMIQGCTLVVVKFIVK